MTLSALSLKRSMHKITAIIILVLAAFSSRAQELEFIVSVNSSQVQTSDQSVFKDMKNSIEQFFNGRKWTTDIYKNHERIKASMLITITKMPDIGSFTASVQVQSARPIFNSNYSSLLFNFADRDWEFEYVESQPLEFNDNTYTTNLTAMLALYAYLVIGLDYDSFSELGGTPYFTKAWNIVNNAQQANRAGWSAAGSSRNRYWIAENLNNPQMLDLRKAIYAYHRLAMDTFEKTPDQSREIILKALQSIKKVRDVNPNAILVISFFDAKSKELTNIFSQGNIQVRRQVYDILVTIDPSNRAYDKIVQ
jgi:hypothetical protein